MKLCWSCCAGFHANPCCLESCTCEFATNLHWLWRHLCRVHRNLCQRRSSNHDYFTLSTFQNHFIDFSIVCDLLKTLLKYLKATNCCFIELSSAIVAVARTDVCNVFRLRFAMLAQDGHGLALAVHKCFQTKAP